MALSTKNKNAQDYPLTGFRFKVVIDDIVEAHFSSVSGLSIETEVVPMQEGGLNTYVHQLKGQTKYSNIVLKRGVTKSAEFIDWVLKSVEHETENPQRRNGTITVFDDNGTEAVFKWTFSEAWPCKYEGPQFDASSSAALIETLELAHHGLKKG